MKKFLPIITGVIVGVAIAAGAIVFKEKTAFGAEGTTWWNEFIAASDAHSFTWDDVFGPDKYGEDMYSLVYAKLITFPGKSALKEVASSSGLTQNEARTVLAGSITPIFNNPDTKTRHITQEQALTMLKEMQEDFALKREAYALEQEVDATIKPSEIFADGDLSNSGFDLVYDLNKIEEILFLNESPVDVGAPYPDGKDSPVSSAEDKQKADGFVANNTDIATSPLASGGLNENGNLQIGDKEIEVDVLDQDVCIDESPSLNSALNNFNRGEGNGNEGGGVGNDGEGASDAENDGNESGNVQRDTGVEPAPADDWSTEWCKGVNENADGSENVDVRIAVCLDIKMLKKTVSSYQPGDSCIACEMEQINNLLDKTLSHSLVPGKATGNILESAKCKNSASFLNFQFIQIWNPVPPAPKDDLIENKNVFEEWNKFVKRYKPLDITGSLWNMKLDTWDTFDQSIDPQSSSEFLQKLKLQSAPGGVTQQELLNSINKDKLQHQAEAITNLQEAEVTTEATNKSVYFDAVLQEVQQMAAFMKNFSDTYQLIIDDAIPKIWSKPDLN